MPFNRRVLHHGSHPAGTPVLLTDRVITGCWFELHRQGGCGSGELTLRDEFDQRHAIEVGDWVSIEATPGDRWYLGRIEERRTSSPAGIQLRLEGMAIELNEIFPGGFGSAADDAAPHRLAGTATFSEDPDRAFETADPVTDAVEVVRTLITQYAALGTHITYRPDRIESATAPAPVVSLKFRGEESLRAIVKEMALRAQSASWGVDAAGEFFFLQQRSNLLATFTENVDLTSLVESRDQEHLFNRVLLTGDYVYDRAEYSGMIARRSYRWRGNFFEPTSRQQYGDRRIRLWIPWIRTQEDSRAFVREFFRIYAHPTSSYRVETIPQETLPLPWLGQIELVDRHGNILTTSMVESVRINFDHAPRFRFELGPIDPRRLWPEPPHDERWEIPDGSPPAGGPVTAPINPPPGGGNSGAASSSDQPDSLSSDASSELSSLSSENSSLSSTGSSLAESSPFPPLSSSGTETSATPHSSMTSGFEPSSSKGSSSASTLSSDLSESFTSTSSNPSSSEPSSTSFPHESNTSLNSETSSLGGSSPDSALTSDDSLTVSEPSSISSITGSTSGPPASTSASDSDPASGSEPSSDSGAAATSSSLPPGSSSHPDESDSMPPSESEPASESTLLTATEPSPTSGEPVSSEAETYSSLVSSDLFGSEPFSTSSDHSPASNSSESGI